MFLQNIFCAAIFLSAGDRAVLLTLLGVGCLITWLLLVRRQLRRSAASAIPGVNAKAESTCDYSGHADSAELLVWMGKSKRCPKRIVVHGEAQALGGSQSPTATVPIPPAVEEAKRVSEMKPGEIGFVDWQDVQLTRGTLTLSQFRTCSRERNDTSQVAVRCLSAAKEGERKGAAIELDLRQRNLRWFLDKADLEPWPNFVANIVRRDGEECQSLEGPFRPVFITRDLLDLSITDLLVGESAFCDPKVLCVFDDKTVSAAETTYHSLNLIARSKEQTLRILRMLDGRLAVDLSGCPDHRWERTAQYSNDEDKYYAVARIDFVDAAGEKRSVVGEGTEGAKLPEQFRYKCLYELAAGDEGFVQICAWHLHPENHRIVLPAFLTVYPTRGERLNVAAFKIESQGHLTLDLTGLNPGSNLPREIYHYCAVASLPSREKSPLPEASFARK
jgi:hypothetical protein